MGLGRSAGCSFEFGHRECRSRTVVPRAQRRQRRFTPLREPASLPYRLEQDDPHARVLELADRSRDVRTLLAEYRRRGFGEASIRPAVEPVPGARTSREAEQPDAAALSFYWLLSTDY